MFLWWYYYIIWKMSIYNILYYLYTQSIILLFYDKIRLCNILVKNYYLVNFTRYDCSVKSRYNYTLSPSALWPYKRKPAGITSKTVTRDDGPGNSLRLVSARIFSRHSTAIASTGTQNDSHYFIVNAARKIIWGSNRLSLSPSLTQTHKCPERTYGTRANLTYCQVKLPTACKTVYRTCS